MEPNQIVLSDRIPISQTPAGIYLAGLRPASRETMKYALQKIAKILLQTDDPVDIFYFPWHNLDYGRILAVRSILDEKYSINTANTYLMGLRGVLKGAWRAELLTHDQYERLVDFQLIQGFTLPKGRALSEGELEKLLQVCIQDRTFRGRRDEALIAILYSTGLRRNELVHVKLEDMSSVEISEGRLGYRLFIKKGKKRKERYVYINSEARGCVDRYLNLRSSDATYLIGNALNASEPDRPISTQTIYDILAYRSSQANIPQVRPHDLRKTMITRLLESGVDELTIIRLTGHASTDILRTYDRRRDEVSRDAIFDLSFPKLTP